MYYVIILTKHDHVILKSKRNLWRLKSQTMWNLKRQFINDVQYLGLEFCYTSIQKIFLYGILVTKGERNLIFCITLFMNAPQLIHSLKWIDKIIIKINLNPDLVSLYLNSMNLKSSIKTYNRCWVILLWRWSQIGF